MTEEEKPTRSKVVSMCGRELPVGGALHPRAAEAKETREQLIHWSTKATRYVALFELEDGSLAYCGSMDDVGVALQYATTMHRLAQDQSHHALTGERPQMVEDGGDDSAA
jgi:hypothetical protein